MAKLHCTECFNQKCITERTNLQTAILNFAEVFDDIYSAYLAQDKLVTEMILTMNSISTNFALPIHFNKLTDISSMKKLHNMAKKVFLKMFYMALKAY